jgi:capsular exopolysaccharide synthesis family protein
MNDKTNSFNDLNNQEEGFDVKKIIYIVRRQWYWLALFGALGLIGGYVFNKLIVPKYLVNTTIMVPEKSNGLDMKTLFQGAIDVPQNNLYNQIEIINSYYTINQALLNLNWRTDWYKKDLFVWRGIYKQEPFEVQEAQNFINPKGIAIYITPISGDRYNVSVDGKIYQNNAIIDVKFEGTGTFGQPFVNKFFSFTLQKKANNFESPSGKYYFTFNDLTNTTLAYQSRLNTSLKDKKSDIIECSIVGEEPQKEIEFLNELIRVYTQGKIDVQNEAQRRSLDFINNQLAGISDSLNTASTKFADFRSKNNVIDLGAEGTLVMNNLKEIESEKAKAQMQLNYFQDLLNYLNNTNDLTKLVSPSVVGIQDASLNALVLQLGELYNRRQVLSFSAKENNPTLVMLDKELSQTRNQLNENLRNLINNATRNINSQTDRQAQVSVQLNRLPQKEQKMVNIQRQFNLTNELYTFLLQKRAETNISLASNIPDIQVIDIARYESAMEMGLGLKKILIIGFIFGLSIPLAYILLLNFFDDRIRTQEDLEKSTSIPILGNIMHSQSESELAVHDYPKSNIAESFRALRTNLQYMLTGDSGKVISIHSTDPGEGKSFSSINLAIILAVNNKKVLLIGADMRKPRLHKAFNVENEKGLSSYLIGIDTLEQAIVPTVVENLSFLPSGPIPPNPAEILGKPEMKGLIDAVRSQFEYIIIDNAPTALVTDGHIVGHFSDLNIFILRYGFSHKHQIEIINQYAEKKILDNVAILVNDIKANAFGNSYYKYYQYESYQKTYYSDEDEGTKKFRKKKSK